MPSTSAILIFGGDEYLVSAKAKETVNALVPPSEQALGLDVIDGNVDTVDTALSAMASCLEALKTVSLFNQGKVVWFRDVTFLTDNRTGRSESVKTRVSELAAMIKGGLPSGVNLVVTATAVDKRYAFYKACKSAGTLVEFAVSDKAYQSERDAAERVGEILSKVGLRMSQPVRDVFLAKVGTDTRSIVGEKLSLYIGGKGEVTIDDVKAVTSASRGAIAWDLSDAFGKRDLAGALVILRQLVFQKESSVGLVLAIESRVRDLMIYREALDNKWLTEGKGYGGRTSYKWGKVPPDVDRTFTEDFQRDPRKTHPFRANLLAEQARRFSRVQLARAHRMTIAAHEKIVSTSLPDEMILELLLTKILAKRKQARG